MDMPDASFKMERLAAKTVYAADLLASTVDIADHLKKLEIKVNRYIRQVRLIVTWKRASGMFTMVGSAAKTAGGVMVLAAPLHPKLGLAVKVGHRLWKLGAGLKILTAISGMLKEFWNDGCRNTLMEFTRSVAVLTTKVGVFQEVVSDLQGVTRQININSNNAGLEAPAELVHVMREFIPHQQIDYAVHVLNIVFGSQRYSPMFDFMTHSTDCSNNSDIAKVIREVESLHFTEFAEENNGQALLAIGCFLHISRELLDFLDGFRKVTEKDCRFLEECLTKFTDESMAVMKAVSLLSGLCKLSQSIPCSQDQQISISTQNHNSSSMSTNTFEKVDNDPVESSKYDEGDKCDHDYKDNSDEINECNQNCDDDCQKVSDEKPIQSNICDIDTVPDRSNSTCSHNENTSSNREVAEIGAFQTIHAAPAQAISNSKEFLLKKLSGVASVVNEGAKHISKTVQRKRKHPDFDSI